MLFMLGRGVRRAAVDPTIGKVRRVVPQLRLAYAGGKLQSAGHIDGCIDELGDLAIVARNILDERRISLGVVRRVLPLDRMLASIVVIKACHRLHRAPKGRLEANLLGEGVRIDVARRGRGAVLVGGTWRGAEHARGHDLGTVLIVERLPMEPRRGGDERAESRLELPGDALEIPLVSRAFRHVQRPYLHQVAGGVVGKRQAVRARLLIDHHRREGQTGQSFGGVGHGGHAAEFEFVTDMIHHPGTLLRRHDVARRGGNAELARKYAGLKVVVDTHLERQLILDQWNIVGARDIVARAAVVHIETLDIDETTLGFRIGGAGDHADRAAHGRGAEQRALGAAEHLDAFHVENARIQRQRHGCVVDVKTRGVGTSDAANGHLPRRGDAKSVAGPKRQIGNGMGVIGKPGGPDLLQSVA